ncbi:unnamed protein product [Caenorhabditis auriculariae]|uniref:t-SNARE coiled-coil homology domain-containing protein n=1 Tax=Caenorhabditis auriculariae TaxID=2777116 RepID=A0A8S1GXH4_9PELO|nr:unnamed protein product [Caenorhabditis auriculariae]
MIAYRGGKEEEKMSLIDLEDAGSRTQIEQPYWIHTVDEVDFEFERVRARMEELSARQRKRLSRPNMGDDLFDNEQKEMQQSIEQITQMLAHCQRMIRMLSTQTVRGEKVSERKIRNNAAQTLNLTLSQLTNSFRSEQVKHLRDVEHRSRNVTNYLVTHDTDCDETNWNDLLEASTSAEYTMDELQLFMSNDKEVREREKKVLTVNASIGELNTIFKEVSNMIIDQGTMIDRIDFNVEQSSVRVSRAVDDVNKAERHQRQDRKMHCICLLTLKKLQVAQLNYDYLHSNSTNHDTMMGAISELVDNSRDAGATKLIIDQGDDQISFLDNGCGMSKSEAGAIMVFGKSDKLGKENMIGRYGNGLKSGAMHLANDFILLTKKDGICTVLLVSRTFLEKHHFGEVYFPLPSFTSKDFEPVFCDRIEEERFDFEMKLIMQYSPFKTIKELLNKFNKIQGDHGTLIILYGLRKSCVGSRDLIPDMKNHDLVLETDDPPSVKNSLRCLLSILYLNPTMQIYLLGKKVETVKLLARLCNLYEYTHWSKSLKSSAEEELQNCEKRLARAKALMSLAQTKVGELNRSFQPQQFLLDKKLKMKMNFLEEERLEAAKIVDEWQVKQRDAQKNIQSPKPVTIFVGVNLHNRRDYGNVFYNNGRLISAFGNDQKEKQKDDKPVGVVAVVDIPYSIVAPNISKQSFSSIPELKSLEKTMNLHIEDYCRQTDFDNFDWEGFGYTRDRLREPKKELAHKRESFTGYLTQCDHCFKWRILRENPGPEFWICSGPFNCRMEEKPVPAKKAQLNKTPARRRAAPPPTRQPEPEPVEEIRHNRRRQPRESYAGRPIEEQLKVFSVSQKRAPEQENDIIMLSDDDEPPRVQRKKKRQNHLVRPEVFQSPQEMKVLGSSSQEENQDQDELEVHEEDPLGDGERDDELHTYQDYSGKFETETDPDNGMGGANYIAAMNHYMGQAHQHCNSLRAIYRKLAMEGLTEFEDFVHLDDKDLANYDNAAKITEGIDKLTQRKKNCTTGLRRLLKLLNKRGWIEVREQLDGFDEDLLEGFELENEFRVFWERIHLQPLAEAKRHDARPLWTLPMNNLRQVSDNLVKFVQLFIEAHKDNPEMHVRAADVTPDNVAHLMMMAMSAVNGYLL